MPPKNPEDLLDFTFILNSVDYPIRMRRGAIVHEAFHIALPTQFTAGHRLIFRTLDGREIYPDNFLGDLIDHLGIDRVDVFAEPIPTSEGTWRNIGFDHLAISVEDRPGARDFLRDVVQMRVMRDDPHLTVITTGPTTLLLFDAGRTLPSSSGAAPTSTTSVSWSTISTPPTLTCCKTTDRLISDFTMLERDERWSLYFFYRNGAVTFMIQFSEIKPG